MENHSRSSVMAGISIAVGIALAGWFIADALYALKASERYVSVKGLAEREVPADLVIWPISITVTGDDLADVYKELESDGSSVMEFLHAKGFNSEEIEESTPVVVDFLARGYSGQSMPEDRYKVTVIFTLRSGDVQKVKVAMKMAGSLVKKGIVVDESYSRTPQFMFTGLNSIKPEMIAQATGNARKAAEQFARDSGSRVGAIKNARQGFFSITNIDMYTPEIKKVRVVTSVDYFLE